MAFILTLLYPKTEKFDMNYYLNSHMPLATKHFSSYGFVKWEVAELDPSSGYVAQCLLYFKDKEGADKSFAEGAQVMADIPNYTDAKPLIVKGPSVASG